nr:lysM domain receptor-like kinase 4 [Ipomoea batatas]
MTGSNRAVLFTPLLILGAVETPVRRRRCGRLRRRLGVFQDGLTAGLGFPLANRKLSKFVRRAPGKMGCFIFFRFAYIFTAADLDSIKFSCSVLEDFSAVVLTDLSREKLKQEVLSDADDFQVDSRNSVSDKEDDEESARSWNPKFDSNGGGGGLVPFTLSLTFWFHFNPSRLLLMLQINLRRLRCRCKLGKKGEAEMVTKSLEAAEKPLKKKLDEEVGLSYESVSYLVEMDAKLAFKAMGGLLRKRSGHYYRKHL